MNEKITCSFCHAEFRIESTRPEHKLQFCPFCRSTLSEGKGSISQEEESSASSLAGSASFIQEHVPATEHIQYSLGNYQILKSIGKGGMGEVFLAYDTVCGRQLAIKQIRPDLVEHKQLHNRFLKEARITSQLTHPAIIPIYTINNEDGSTYYTMPYIQGKTLREIIKNERVLEKKGRSPTSSSESIPTLIRIFLSVCQAVAYAHSKKVLHRDLKPENIIVGHYGQIVILDWGLAKLSKESAENPIEASLLEHGDDDDATALHHLTRIGKVVGTVGYMAPERALGMPADFRTDIYSLGAILYQLLTLKHPFQRASLKWFREHMHQEKVAEPLEIAPYRDVPRSLSMVVMKCLSYQPEQRYQSVDALIRDLENYIEGKSEWFQIADLNVAKKSDWEFQENVFLAEHAALTQGPDISDWVSLMISKEPFQENIKIEASVKLGADGFGVGLLFNIPETSERHHLNDGYCLWLASDRTKATKLMRSTVEVMQAPEVFLQRDKWHRIRLEKVDNNIHFYLDDELQISYISHLPITGTHVGILTRDANYMLKDFKVYVRSPNVTVNCLAVPDAFLTHQDYEIALSEYRRISSAFRGRAEGREAMFRAGITLLEQGNNAQDPKHKQKLYDQALDEFYKLHETPGAPLEYLGKALVYRALEDLDEETKCYELAFRRYKKHPLLPILYEHVLYRMHESSRFNRRATYKFLLLALRFLPEAATEPNTQKLLNSLERHWEPLPFFIKSPGNPLTLRDFAYNLSFWLDRPYVILELIDQAIQSPPFDLEELGNAFWLLLKLGNADLIPSMLDFVTERADKEWNQEKQWIDLALQANTSLEAAVTSFVATAQNPPTPQQNRLLFYLMSQCLLQQKHALIEKLAQKSAQFTLTPQEKQKKDSYLIWNYLQKKAWKEAGDLLNTYPIELLSQDNSIVHFLQGCWLVAKEGKESASIHFAGLLDTPYPRSWSLVGYYLKERLESTKWFEQAFLWEKRQLYRQLALYAHCEGNEKEAKKYQQLAQNPDSLTS